MWDTLLLTFMRKYIKNKHEFSCRQRFNVFQLFIISNLVARCVCVCVILYTEYIYFLYTYSFIKFGDPGHLHASFLHENL